MSAILEPGTHVTICPCEHTVVLIMRSACVFCVHKVHTRHTKDCWPPDTLTPSFRLPIHQVPTSLPGFSPNKPRTLRVPIPPFAQLPSPTPPFVFFPDPSGHLAQDHPGPKGEWWEARRVGARRVEVKFGWVGGKSSSFFPFPTLFFFNFSRFCVDFCWWFRPLDFF